jgi:hypothetical protein
MPVSIRRYTELKLSISDYLQRRNWAKLFELCGTSDDDTAKTIAVILTFYNQRKIWGFLDYAYNLSAEERRERRDSVGTICYILGKIGQTSTEKSLNYLRRFLLDDRMLRWQVTAALSNLWVLDTRTTSRIILSRWILRNEDNDDLTEVGVRSCEYLAKNAPERVSPFLHKVAAMTNERKTASRAARELIQMNELSSKRKLAPKVQKKK